MKFTQEQNKVLSEIYRRLNKLHKGNLNENLLYLTFPSEAKKIKRFGLIKPYSKEIPRVLNWYNLTEKGKVFFNNYITEIDDSTSYRIFEGTYVKKFDPSFIPNDH